MGVFIGCGSGGVGRCSVHEMGMLVLGFVGRF